MTAIRNPILPGFNPDPSICRVGEDYYIATSTFEWYPGVQIHHSRDLANWRLVKRPLDRPAQLDMRGNPDSGGIYAPCLSHADGKFWLVYTDVKRFGDAFNDAHNYLAAAPAIEGPWSDPVTLNSSGFDASLFHDEDGRKWLVNMVWDHRDPPPRPRPHHAFAGIRLQQYDPTAQKLIGEARMIFEGSALGLVEGPHLFRRGGWYYLTTAEGGTGYDHAVTMARSRNLAGPYELHPNTHLITSKDAPDAPLQRAGHGQIVETADGQVYHTHLCSRPLPGARRSPLGRETALQKCVWRDDDWLYLAQGGRVPALEIPPPAPIEARSEIGRIDYEFRAGPLPDDFQWLRTPYPERIFSLEARPGRLRLIARESIGSWFEQALVARRQAHFTFDAETELEFAPRDFQQAAGLVLYYNRYKFHFLAITQDEQSGRALTILSCAGDFPRGRLTYPMPPIALPPGPVRLRASVDRAQLQFYALWPQTGEAKWKPVGPTLDASLISDEAGGGEHCSFTGAFVGMAAFDTSGEATPADFASFAYAGRD
ncbi:MAG: glycoside hydrolase family 43 protein [Bradyrhizobium sp.]|nr:MAG: glycoside hydrolase family 43 protein [Bradyrhizobium sp.]